jgi:hypothetical protein
MEAIPKEQMSHRGSRLWENGKGAQNISDLADHVGLRELSDARFESFHPGTTTREKERSEGDRNEERHVTSCLV